MMNRPYDYHVTRQGKVWITAPDGMLRPATDQEWLEIWQSSPAFTLRMAQSQAHVSVKG